MRSISSKAASPSCLADDVAQHATEQTNVLDQRTFFDDGDFDRDIARSVDGKAAAVRHRSGSMSLGVITTGIAIKRDGDGKLLYSSGGKVLPNPNIVASIVFCCFCTGLLVAILYSVETEALGFDGCLSNAL